MRWLVMFGFLLVTLSYISEAGAARELSDNEVQMLMEITGPTWGLHTVCIKDAYGQECTAAYECSTPPEWVEIYRTTRGQKYQVFTDCLDWKLDCPYGGVRDEPGESCQWNVDEGYIKVWLKENGFVIEEVY